MLLYWFILIFGRFDRGHRVNLLTRTPQFLSLLNFRGRLALKNWRLGIAGLRGGLLGLHIAKLLENALYLFFLQFTNQETGQRRVRTIIFSKRISTAHKNRLGIRLLRISRLAWHTPRWLRNRYLGDIYWLFLGLNSRLDVWLS